MVNELEEIDYFEAGNQCKTGTEMIGTKSIKYPFDKYEIEVKLAADGTFLGITGISINKDFLSYIQKTRSCGHIDLEKYYLKDSENDPE